MSVKTPAKTAELNAVDYFKTKLRFVLRFARSRGGVVSNEFGGSICLEQFKCPEHAR